MMPYQFVYSTKFGSYAFNGIDMNPNPGPRRPFNFFGHVEQVWEKLTQCTTDDHSKVQGQVVQSWIKVTQGKGEIWYQIFEL